MTEVYISMMIQKSFFCDVWGGEDKSAHKKNQVMQSCMAPIHYFFSNYVISVLAIFITEYFQSLENVARLFG